MKRLKALVIFVLTTGFSLSTALAGNSDQTETRNVKGFNAIKVSTGIDLYLTMDDKEAVKLVADDEIIDKIRTEVKDGTLHIYIKNSWFNWNGNNKTRKAYVSVKELSKLHASSGSDVKTENTLKGETLEVKASSGSDMELDVHYKNLTLDTSSGSDARLSGKVKTFMAEASSGSDIKAKGLNTQICKLRASSGSDIAITVSDELYARASSGGDITYSGNPQVRDTDESSGGDVRKK